MKRRKDTIEYGIIGLGRFGIALATALSEAGKEVMVVDNTESKVKQIRDMVSEAFVVEGIDKASFESAGIQNCETVIVCIGEKIDTSILATLTVISMGVPRVISRPPARSTAVCWRRSEPRWCTRRKISPSVWPGASYRPMRWISSA